MPQFNKNQRVAYEDYLGDRHVGNLVDCDEEDGRFVYVVKLDNGDECWGYEGQFTAIN